MKFSTLFLCLGLIACSSAYITAQQADMPSMDMQQDEMDKGCGCEGSQQAPQPQPEQQQQTQSQQ